ncbi:MAG: hypothetical protein JXJ04_00630 [Spirochaetales bacterium]|nr:hypothetical protein [Spirochaetales bacterium]
MSITESAKNAYAASIILADLPAGTKNAALREIMGLLKKRKAETRYSSKGGKKLFIQMDSLRRRTDCGGLR